MNKELKRNRLFRILLFLPAVILASSVGAQNSISMDEQINFSKNSAMNKELTANGPGEGRVVFMGNSITEFWPQEFFVKNGYINRGISGQTTPLMLLRFREDVIQLNPEAVVILAGINDIAENTGPTTVDRIFGNIVSMVELARQNGIRVILCSVLPANRFYWNPDIDPVEKITQLNSRLESYALKNELSYVDFYKAMADENKGLPLKYSEDGVHPNNYGYAVMEPLVMQAINSTTGKK